MQQHRVFTLRMHDEGSDAEARWRGVIELVGSDDRQAIETLGDVTRFIQQRLPRWVSGEGVEETHP